MTKCKSTFTTIAELYDDYGKYVAALAGVAVGVATANPAAVVEAVAKADRIDDALNHAHDAWNGIIGKGGIFNIGPRPMEPGTTYEGAVISKGQRTYISTAPLHFQQGMLTVEEQGGRAKTDIRVCLVDGRGEHTEIAAVTWNESSEERSRQNQVLSQRLTGAQGMYLVVLFTGLSVTNKLQYSLRLTQG